MTSSVSLLGMFNCVFQQAPIISVEVTNLGSPDNVVVWECVWQLELLIPDICLMIFCLSGAHSTAFAWCIIFRIV